MAEKINSQVKHFGALALAKVGAEQIGMRTPIGNGTIMSGIIKGVVGGVLLSQKYSYAKFAGAGFMLDGIEDLIENSVNKVTEKAEDWF